MNPLITTLGLALALSATTVAASAQQTAAQTAPQPVAAARTQSALVVRPEDTKTALGYQNADALRGIYTRPPMIAQCANRPVVGPMPTAAAGSMEAQPNYNFLIDFRMTGDCTKTL